MSRKRRTVADEPYLVVRTSASDPGDGAEIGEHRHDWHQLIYVSSGLMTVRTRAGSWLAPSTSAVWVPAGIAHALRFVGPSALRTAYVRPDWSGDAPTGCRCVAVSPLLRELVLRASATGALDRREPTETAIATLLIHELSEAGPPPFTLPEPTSAATIHAAAILAESATASTPVVARAVGLGVRTLERRFLSETGLTLGRWRQHRTLLYSLELLAGGASTTAASAAAGYRSPSAYVSAFRKAFGTTPGHYFDSRGPA